MRYIHQNPLKAGITRTLGAYSWSSYSQYIGNAGIVDIHFALGIFSEERERAKKLFRDYSMKETMDECLEYQEKTVVKDQELFKYLHNVGITSISQLQHLGKEQRDDLIRRLKERDGVTIRQLARITGISKSVIDRA